MFNPAGGSPFLLIGDHAGLSIPKSLETLGVGPDGMARHIASDIGIRGLGQLLSARLDAPFIAQRYSRLVIDCNRDPARADAIVEASDGTVVPGNASLSEADRRARIEAIHRPYHAAIEAEIDGRTAAGLTTVLIALHSFTPAMDGFRRPWQAGVLHHAGETRFAYAMLDALRGVPGLTIGDNEPYRMDETDFTIPHHAYPRGLDHVELEIRQDLITEEAGQREWAERLGELLPRALGAIR